MRRVRGSFSVHNLRSISEQDEKTDAALIKAGCDMILDHGTHDNHFASDASATIPPVIPADFHPQLHASRMAVI